MVPIYPILHYLLVTLPLIRHSFIISSNVMYSISLEITTVFNVDGISFSRFVKTTLYDLNYADYSEYYRTFWIYLLAKNDSEIGDISQN